MRRSVGAVGLALEGGQHPGEARGKLLPTGRSPQTLQAAGDVGRGSVVSASRVADGGRVRLATRLADVDHVQIQSGVGSEMGRGEGGVERGS